MMPNIIPANGEAMPKTTRRSFLAGAAVVLAPSCAAARVAVPAGELEPSSLAALISRYGEATAEVDRLGDLLIALWDDPMRPPVGGLMEAELPHEYQVQMKFRAVFTIDGINRLFDGAIKLVELHSLNLPDGAYLARRVAKIEEDRAHWMAVWEFREATYQEWAISSGYRELSDEQDRFSILEDELNRLILSHPVSSLADVRLKAEHVSTVYGSSLSGEDQATFLASLMGEGEA